MNLVIGATGMVGTEVCRALVEAGKPATAMVRPSADPVKVKALEVLGVTIVRGDLRDRASLDAACQGARTIIATASAMPFAYTPGENTPERTDREGCISLVDAARGRGRPSFRLHLVPADVRRIPAPGRQARR